MARVPPELVDHIVDYLKDDRVVLKVCSLLSTQWSACARARLFHTAKFEKESDLQRWKNLVLSSPDIGTRYLRKIDYDVLGGYRRHLESGQSPESWYTFHGYSPVLVSMPDLGPLPRVTTVKLAWSSGSARLSIQDIEPFARSLTSLEHLTISQFPSLRIPSQLLSLFRCLKTLKIINLNPRIEHPSPDSITPDTLNVTFDGGALETLAFDFCTFASYTLVSDCILRSTAPLRLRSLSAGAGNWRSWPYIISIVNLVSTTIEELSFDFLLMLDDRSFPDANTETILRPLPQLLRISLRIVTGIFDPSRSSMVAASNFIRSLRTIRSLMTLDIEIFLNGTRGDEHCLDAMVTWGIKERFPNIQNIHVHLIYLVVTDGELRPLVDKLRSLMGEWNVRSRITSERMRKGNVKIGAEWRFRAGA